MTFLDLDLDAADLAVELYFAGDAPDLDSAASLAADLQGALADYGIAWDRDIGNLAAEAYSATGEPEAADTMFAALPF